MERRIRIDGNSLERSGAVLDEDLVNWKRDLVANGMTEQEANLVLSGSNISFAEKQFEHLPDKFASLYLNTADRLTEQRQRRLTNKEKQNLKAIIVYGFLSGGDFTGIEIEGAPKMSLKWQENGGRGW